MTPTSPPRHIDANPPRAPRRGLSISRSAAVAGVLLYLLHLGIIYVLTDNVHRLEHRVFDLERDNARLTKRLEVLNVVRHHQRGFSEVEVARVVQVIDHESDRFGIDPLLILAVILTESEFKRFQVSNKGAMGLMQIRPFVAKDLALRRGIDWNEETGLFDPSLNVQVGTTYLFELILQFNNLTDALTAYAYGETRFRQRRALGRPTPQNYSRRVLKRYELLVDEYRTPENRG